MWLAFACFALSQSAVLYIFCELFFYPFLDFKRLLYRIFRFLWAPRDSLFRSTAPDAAPAVVKVKMDRHEV